MSFASPFGPVPFSGLPYGAADLSQESPVTQLLAGELRELAVLMHLRPWDPGSSAAVDIYVSDGGFASGTLDTWPTGGALPHQYFLEVLARPPVREGRVLQDGEIATGAAPVYGEAVLADVARERAAWLGYGWDGAEFRTYLGAPDWPLSQFSPTGRGDVQRLQPGSMASTLYLRSIVARLQRDIEPRTYEGMGACLEFDGINDVVTFGDVLDQAGSFSLQARVWPDSAVLSTARIWSKGDATTGWLCYVDALNVGFIIRGSGSIVTTSSPLAARAWNDVIVTYDASTNRGAIIVNGSEEIASTAFTADPVATAHVLALGARADTAFPFDGRIDEAAIWSKALTPSEARALQSKELFGDEAGLVGAWHLNEATGPTIFDATAGGHDGTISGARWTGSLTGTKELAGKRRLRGWGWLRNWSPALVDEVDLVYEVLAQPAVAFDNLRVRGAASYVYDGDLADPYTWTPVAGHWVSALSFAGSSYIRLGSAPDGEVTLDVQATAETDAASVAEAIALEAGLEADDIDEGAFAALATAYPYPVGVGSRFEKVTADALIVDALFAIQAWRTTDIAGRLTADALMVPTSPVAELTEDDLDLDGCERLHTLPAARSVTVLYRRNWTPQSADALASSLSARERLDFGQELRSYTTPDNEQVLEANDSAPTPVITTCLDREADARALAERIAEIRSLPVHTDRVPLLYDRYDLQEGLAVRVTAPAIDYDAGRVVLISGATRDDGTRKHVLEVWGP